MENYYTDKLPTSLSLIFVKEKRDQFILTYVTTYVQWQFIDSYDFKQHETTLSFPIFHAGKLIKSYFVIVRKSIQDR